MAYNETPLLKGMTMENKIDSVKKFVSKHRVAIAVTATATLASVAHIAVIAQHNEFLKEHDLLDEYYNMDE